MKIAIIYSLMWTVTTGGLIDASKKTSIKARETDKDFLNIETAKAIVELGHEVTVFSSDYYKPKGSVGDSFPGLEVKYLPTRLKRVFPPAFVPFMPSIYDEIKSGGFDVVQSREFLDWGTIFAAMACRKSGTPFVVWHELNVRQKFPGHLIQKVYGRTLGELVKRQADAFIPRSHAARRFLLDRGVSEDKIKNVIPKGVNEKVFRRMNCDKHRLRRKLGLPTGGFLVLSVGRLLPYKGHSHLIDAISDISCNHLDGVNLVIVGAGPEEQGLLVRARERGLKYNVLLVDPVSRDKLVEYYNAADVMALPSSDKELFPNFTILESMACGVPVIYSKHNGGEEIGGDGHCGFYAEFGSHHEIAIALDRLHNDDCRTRMSQNCIDMVEKHFRLAFVAREFESIYRTVV